jgi:hypothetical protein
LYYLFKKHMIWAFFALTIIVGIPCTTMINSLKTYRMYNETIPYDDSNETSQYTTSISVGEVFDSYFPTYEDRYLLTA